MTSDRPAPHDVSPDSPAPVNERDLPRVRFLSGSLAERELVVPASGCTIGRSRRCTIRLDPTADSIASGEHVTIGYSPGLGWWLEDAGSTNGTWAGLHRISGRTAIPAENEYSIGSPNSRGCVRFYVAFPAERRKARSQDPVRPRLSDLLAESGFDQGDAGNPEAREITPP